MKSNPGTGNKQNINRSPDKHNMSGVPNKKRPEIRDNLDSRERTEHGKKGGDVTHNKQEDLQKGNKEK